MGVFGSETPGDRLSKIGPSNYGHGAARECNLKRGAILHEQITSFVPHIVRIYLWLSQITRPFERRSRGGGSGGSDPTFLGLVRPCTPVSSYITGAQGRPPDGGSLPPQ